MINELNELAQTLKHQGLLPPNRSVRIGPLPEGDCLLIEVDSEGKPRSVRCFNEKIEQTPSWQYRQSNKAFFPRLKITNPILSKSESEKIDEKKWNAACEECKRLLIRMLDLSKIDFQKGDGKDVEKPLCNIAIASEILEELNVIEDDKTPELNALRQLIRVFPRNENQINFIKNLLILFQSSFDNADGKLLDFMKDILVGTTSKGSDRKSNSICYFDVYETWNFISLSRSPVTEKFIGEITCRKNKNENFKGYCSISGKEDIEMWTENYPLLNFKDMLNPNTQMFSRNEKIHCLNRYKMSGSKSFQVSREAIVEAKSAFNFITQSENKNKTWRPFYGRSNKDKDLLIAYLADDINNEALFAEFLAQGEQGIESYVYNELCRQIIDKTIDYATVNKSAKINMLLFETLDNGRKQIMMEQSWSVSKFIENAKDWKDGLGNIPEIRIPKFNEGKVAWDCPLVPTASSIYWLLKTDATGKGESLGEKEKTGKSSEMFLRECYFLYMPCETTVIDELSRLSNFLEKVNNRYFFILSKIGELRTRLRNVRKFENVEKFLKNEFDFNRIRLAISLISILLWRLNIKKENYMNNTAFNIGQFLQLTDLLHKEYCVQVRNGGNENKSLPGQLIGNQLFSIAAENPNEGLSRLGERMRIYIAWATTSTGEKCKRAKWILARYNEVCTKISGKEIPKSFNTAEQAQVLLGYLAAIPNEKKVEENTKQGEKENE